MRLRTPQRSAAARKIDSRRSPQTVHSAAAAPVTRGPVPAAMPSAVPSGTLVSGLEAAQVEAIKSAVALTTKISRRIGGARDALGTRRRRNASLFPTESRALAEMLQAREPMEKLRTIASHVLGQPVRVCVKLEAAPVSGAAVRAAQVLRELRAQFEQDPIVRAMLERFGGQISDVKRRGEE